MSEEQPNAEPADLKAAAEANRLVQETKYRGHVDRVMAELREKRELERGKPHE